MKRFEIHCRTNHEDSTHQFTLDFKEGPWYIVMLRQAILFQGFWVGSRLFKWGYRNKSIDYVSYWFDIAHKIESRLTVDDYIVLTPNQFNTIEDSYPELSGHLEDGYEIV